MQGERHADRTQRPVAKRSDPETPATCSSRQGIPHRPVTAASGQSVRPRAAARHGAWTHGMGGGVRLSGPVRVVPRRRHLTVARHRLQTARSRRDRDDRGEHRCRVELPRLPSSRHASTNTPAGTDQRTCRFPFRTAVGLSPIAGGSAPALPVSGPVPRSLAFWDACSLNCSSQSLSPECFSPCGCLHEPLRLLPTKSDNCWVGLAPEREEDRAER